MSNRETFQALLRSWRNGGRFVINMAIICFFTTIVALSAVIYVLVQKVESDPPNPLQSPSPEQILDKKASYRPGDTITVLGSKCNTAKHAVRIFGTSFWQSSEIGGPAGSIPSGGNTASGRDLQPGCMPLSFPHKIPDLAPGKWRFVGRDCTDGGQCSDWFSDEFVVGSP